MTLVPDPTADDRRDSPRVPMHFLVRDAGLTDAEWVERDGDISLGGISWEGKTAALGSDDDVRFRLPGVARELRCRGEIIRVKNAVDTIAFHLRFTEVELDAERAIAKYLDEWLAKLR